MRSLLNRTHAYAFLRYSFSVAVMDTARLQAKEREPTFLSAFLAEKWQTQNFGRELVFSADL